MKTNITKQIIGSFVMIAFVLGLSIPAQAATTWNVTGNHVVKINYLGNDYSHDVSLTQDSSGNLTGNGGSPAGSNTYTWVVTSGSVSGNTIDFYANYTATDDAVTPLTTMHVTGTISADGTMSGTWSDNYQGGSRTGTWTSQIGVLVAEDFGVVDYDTGATGRLAGYTAGFGLTNTTLEGATSVVVKLYSGSTLLQTNTAIMSKFNADVTGTQFSSPFDVTGSFDYAEDGYWINTRSKEFGKRLPATKVVATVTMENGQVVTASNVTLTGDPDDIMPDPKDRHDKDKDHSYKNKCKKGGWKSFGHDLFKNQGKCIKHFKVNR